MDFISKPSSFWRTDISNFLEFGYDVIWRSDCSLVCTSIKHLLTCSDYITQTTVKLCLTRRRLYGVCIIIGQDYEAGNARSVGNEQKPGLALSAIDLCSDCDSSDMTTNICLNVTRMHATFVRRSAQASMQQTIDLVCLWRAQHRAIVDRSLPGSFYASVVVREESPCPRWPIYKTWSLSLSLDLKSLSLSYTDGCVLTAGWPSTSLVMTVTTIRSSKQCRSSCD